MNKKQEKEKTIHRQLVEFWSNTALKTHGIRPTISGKDAKNLQVILKAGFISQTNMEQIMLYFLASPSYRNVSPTISSMLHPTFLNSLRSKAVNRAQFHKELDQYVDRYLRNEPQEVRQQYYADNDDEAKAPVSFADLIEKLKSKLTASNQPRAPMS
jgi:hypothetical protein